MNSNPLPGYDNWKTMSPDEERESRPMTVHIQLVGRSGEVQGSHTMHIHGEDDMEAVISAALVKLLRHSWSMLPGDTLKIVEG